MILDNAVSSAGNCPQSRCISPTCLLCDVILLPAAVTSNVEDIIVTRWS